MKRYYRPLLMLGLQVCMLLLLGQSAHALTNPQNGSVGLETTIPSAAPSRAATIGTPSNGAVVSNIPITVSGLCPSGLLIKVFTNNVFVGSTTCTSGSYQLKVSLFSGRNDLVVRDFDALDQAGPDSNVITVTFNDSQFASFGSRVVLNSNYARRGANPGEVLDWPVTLSGGTGPYAVSVDWGDGKTDLQSVSFEGTIDLQHTYDAAGSYTVIVKATDAKGSTAFLQLVGVANGAVQSSVGTSGSKAVTTTKPVIVWWPLAISIPLLLAAFWLGQRHELYSLRKHLESEL